MGYSRGAAPEPLTEVIGEVSEDLISLGDVRAEYIIFTPVKCNSFIKTVETEGVVFNVKPIIFSQVRKPKK